LSRLAARKEAPAALESATGQEGRDGEHGDERKEVESEPRNRVTAAPILRTSVYPGGGGIFGTEVANSQRFFENIF
jgi:hypothetical protein